MKLFFILLLPLVLQGCTVTCPYGYKLSGMLCFKDEEAIQQASQTLEERLIAQENQRQLDEDARIREYKVAQEKQRAEREAYELSRRAKIDAEHEKRLKDEQTQRLKYKLEAEAADKKRRQELENCLSRNNIGLCVSIEDRPMVNVCQSGNAIRDLAQAFDVQSYAYCYKRDNNAVKVQLIIRNNGTSAIRDVSVNCAQLAESGTILKSDTKTIYKIFAPQNPVSFDLNVYRAQQFSSLRCTVEKWSK